MSNQSDTDTDVGINHTQRDELREIARWHSEYMLQEVCGQDGNTVNRLTEHAETTTVNSLMKLVDQYTQRLVLEGQMEILNNPEKYFVAMSCSSQDCDVSIVSSRALSVVHGTICDPPEATSTRQLCGKHSEEFDEPAYFNEDGEEISGDPETFVYADAVKELLLLEAARLQS